MANAREVTFQEYWDNGLVGDRSIVSFEFLKNYKSNPYQWFNTKRPVFKELKTRTFQNATDSIGVNGFIFRNTIEYALFYWTDVADPANDPNEENIPTIVFPIKAERRLNETDELLVSKEFNFFTPEEGSEETNIFTAETWCSDAIIYEEAYLFLIDLYNQMSALNELSIVVEIGLRDFTQNKTDRNTIRKFPNVTTELNLNFVNFESEDKNEQEKAINMLSALYNKNKIKINSAEFRELPDISVDVFSNNNGFIRSFDGGFSGLIEIIFDQTSGLDSANNITSYGPQYNSNVSNSSPPSSFELTTNINELSRFYPNAATLPFLPFFSSFFTSNSCFDFVFSGRLSVGSNNSSSSATHTETSEFASVSSAQTLIRKQSDTNSAVIYNTGFNFLTSGLGALRVIKKSKKIQEFALDLTEKNFDRSFLDDISNRIEVQGSRRSVRSGDRQNLRNSASSFLFGIQFPQRVEAKAKTNTASSGNFFFARHLKEIVYPGGPDLSVSDSFSDFATTETSSTSTSTVDVTGTASSSVSIKVEKANISNAQVHFYCDASTKSNKYTIPFDVYKIKESTSLNTFLTADIETTTLSGTRESTRFASDSLNIPESTNNYALDIDFDIDIICDRPYLNEFDPNNLV